MKTRIVSLIFIAALMFSFNGNLMAQGGIEEELFKEAFPELETELTFDPKITDLKPDELAKYRAAREKIDNAIDNDLNAFKVGALSADNALVFEYKRLKKAKKELDIEKLVGLLMTWKSKIKAYMGDKAKYGDDKDECVRNIALFQQASKSKKWGEAYNYWNILFHYYPRANKITYSKGATVIEFKYNESKDKKWIDTLMMSYDQRVKFKFFGNGKYPEGYIRGRQAVDLLKHDKEAVEKAYGLFKESVKLQGVKSEPAVLLSFMQATEGMFVKKKIDAAQVVDNYTKLNKLLEEKINNGENGVVKQAQAGVTQLFMRSDASTCEQLIPAFQKRFNNNKDDVEQLEKIARMLSVKKIALTVIYLETWQFRLINLDHLLYQNMR